MNNKVIFMQGHSGSGKSTFVFERMKATDIVLSTDKFFIDDDGNYNFDGSKLEHYHMKTIQALVNAMQDANRENLTDCTIWIDNTNCKKEDVDNYRVHVENAKWEVVFIRMNGNFKSKAPVEVVEQQKEDLRRFDYE